MDLMKVLIKIVFLYKLYIYIYIYIYIYGANDLDQFLVKFLLKN